MSKKNRPEELEDQIMHAEVKEGVKLLIPSAKIDVNEILSTQMKEWDEASKENDEEWSLVAYPVLADGKVALLFELPVYEYEDGDEEDDYPSANRYRVLIFDSHTGKKVDKREFRITNGYATTVFYRDGSLYAPISQEGERSYILFKIAEDHDEGELYIGDNINCLAATQGGDVIVSYDFADTDMDEADDEAPLLSVYHLDETYDDFGKFYDEDTDEPTDEYIVDITLDAQDRIWTLMDDRQTLVLHEKDDSLKTYELPVGNVDTVAMPDDLSCLYVSVFGDSDDKYAMLCCRMEDGEIVDESPRSCYLQVSDVTIGYSSGTTTMKNIMATLINGVIYTTDLNEQNFNS
jgi:hypothetical protein